MEMFFLKNEVNELLNAAPDAENETAFTLRARRGLRSGRCLNVAPYDIVNTDAGRMLRM